MSAISEMIKNNEKTFKGAIELKYYFSPSIDQTNHLLVGFSGFNGKEEQGEAARYNYVKQLNNVNMHKLFILDSYNNQPCYYIGKNKSLDYEVTVTSLITYISNQYTIPMKNIITFGTSKGGTAALYFGMKYRLGHIIAGGFQTRVGDYLYNVNEFTRNTLLKLITGGSSEKDCDYLNKFYSKVLDNPHPNTEYNLHGGLGDYHYINFVKPFVENINNNNIPCNVDVKDYSDHTKIGDNFTDYLYEQISRITGKVIIKGISAKTEGRKIITSCSVPNSIKSDKSIRYAFYLLKDKDAQVIKKIPYGTSPNVSFIVEETGSYRVRVYVKNDKELVKVGTSPVTVY